MLAAISCGDAGPDAIPETQSRPNFLFLYTDDQAAWALSREHESDAHTPNLDRLFAQGARFTNSFTTTPVCSPSRAAMMTSRYGSELGITDFLNHSAEPDLGLDPETVTWPEVLQAAGYDTGLIGKWHLGEKDRYHPTRAGFDYFASEDPQVLAAKQSLQAKLDESLRSLKYAGRNLRDPRADHPVEIRGPQRRQ